MRYPVCYYKHSKLTLCMVITRSTEFIESILIESEDNEYASSN